MDTKQIINGLLDRADRVADQSAGRIMKKAAKRLEELQKHNDALECERQAWLHDQERQRWIPVTERLPDGNENCLVLTEVGHCVVAYHNNVLWRVLWNNDRLDNDEVTHWMPLPKPPKEE